MTSKLLGQLLPASHLDAPRVCPRCGTAGARKWGRFNGRQRYRCVACARTYSALTGTPLHYLKRTDAWPAFCQAMRRSLTVAAAARLCGIHADTAFRWRHRFLSTLLADERGVLHGPATLGIIYFRYSRKGAPHDAPPKFLRPEDRKPLPTLLSWVGMGLGRRWVPGPWMPVAWARDSSGCSVALLGSHPDDPHLPLLQRALRDRACLDVVLHHPQGPFSAHALCARSLGLGYVRVRPGSADIESVSESAIRIKRWLIRFRGVATKYLPHYLAWFRALDVGWSESSWDVRRLAMLP